MNAPAGAGRSGIEHQAIRPVPAHGLQGGLTEPRLIVEVLSDSTEAFDRGAKFEHYRRIPTLAEYVPVDPLKQTVEVFRRDETGHWVLYDDRGEDRIVLESVKLSLNRALLFENV